MTEPGEYFGISLSMTIIPMAMAFGGSRKTFKQKIPALLLLILLIFGTVSLATQKIRWSALLISSILAFAICGFYHLTAHHGDKKIYLFKKPQDTPPDNTNQEEKT